MESRQDDIAPNDVALAVVVKQLVFAQAPGLTFMSSRPCSAPAPPPAASKTGR